jgi:hypothetical protein
MFANRFQSNFPHIGSIQLKLMRYVLLVLAVCIQTLNDDSEFFTIMLLILIYVQVDILPTCRKHIHDRSVSP